MFCDCIFGQKNKLPSRGPGCLYLAILEMFFQFFVIFHIFWPRVLSLDFSKQNIRVWGVFSQPFFSGARIVKNGSFRPLVKFWSFWWNLKNPWISSRKIDELSCILKEYGKSKILEFIKMAKIRQPPKKPFWDLAKFSFFCLFGPWGPLLTKNALTEHS